MDSPRFQNGDDQVIDQCPLPRGIGGLANTAPPHPFGARQRQRAASVRYTRYFVWDDLLKGFGVRVETSGRKFFIVRYRAHGGGRRAPLEPRRQRGDQLRRCAQGSRGGAGAREAGRRPRWSAPQSPARPDRGRASDTSDGQVFCRIGAGVLMRAAAIRATGGGRGAFAHDTRASSFTDADFTLADEAGALSGHFELLACRSSTSDF